MRARRIALALLGLCAFAAPPAPALGSPAEEAAWKITSTSLPTNFAPGSEGEIFLVATNLGAKATAGAITITDQVPAGLEILKDDKGNYRIGAQKNDLGASNPQCEASGQKVTCTNEAIGNGDIVAGSTQVTGLLTTAGAFAVGSEIQGMGIPAGTTIVSRSATELTLSNAATLTAAGVELTTPPGTLRPGYHIEVSIKVKAPLTAQVASNQATVKGGGAQDASTTSAVVISPDEADFGFLAGTVGLDAPFTDPDGAVSDQAGSHPYQLTLDVGFPTKLSGEFTVGAGHLHDAAIDFPPGVIINPAATPELCSEAELVGESSCPPASQVGILNILTKPAVTQAGATPIYNMVPPPGEAAVLGADVLGIGIFVHLLGELRSDGDYGITGYSTEIPALPTHPAFGSRVDLWGNPTSALHDAIRGACAPPFQGVETCPLKAEQRADVAMITLPGRCPADPLHFGARAHAWEELAAPAATASYEGSDLAGAPSHIQGCGALDFEPELKVRPTTELADSPTGLDAELTQSIELSPEDKSPSPLRDALVTLPPGLSANASQADGLEVCSSAQIGMLTGIGQSPVHLSKVPERCPDAAKLGTVEVESPLLAQIDEEDNVVYDAQGDPVPRPVHGNLFLAKPFDNPFGSLLAVYIAVDDPRSGVVAKFAGKVEPDPLTGQLATRFSENPQLPLKAVRLHLFAGPRASLQTPPACGPYTTTSTLTPWAAPDLPDANPSDGFEVSASPSGGACPASEAAAPHAPAFVAGTLSPRAGAFSPLIFKLSREDGSQRIAGLQATLPGGLLARLVGVAQCSEAEIAAARARSAPEEGKLEQVSPSCPAASAVGTVDVGAGAGPSPVHIGGRAYLAGPYKGAPLSVVVITPAIAGPFDLGTVVVRSALYIDPTTAQGRILSDPLPSILQGIPTDVRSVVVRSDRPNFTLNPTSCEPKSFLATATSTLGQAAALSSPFQVGGCEALGFAPKLSLRLFGGTHRGAHPRLRAVLTARPGDANIARSSVALPHSEFIDQAHFRTICTRVQFAAEQCPAGSVYGQITATTPLLDYALQGPLYLRSSSHKLPDVVAALKGPPSQPIEVELVGRVDSINGGIRTTFETVPDAPVTKAIVSLQGGKKGLFQNSTNICRGAHRATVKMDGQNGKFHDTRPLLRVRCGKGGGKGKGGGAGKRR
jgi:hypothetical protein